MSWDDLLARLPPYASDLKQNLSFVLQQPELTPQQTWGTALASAVACRNRPLLKAITAEAERHLTSVAQNAARTAASLMAMTNVYYRFPHLAGNDQYLAIASRLRMNGTRTHGADLADFHLWCIAVSALYGCEACVAAHERKLRERAVPPAAILAAVRIAAVLHALAVVLDAEAAGDAGPAPA